ncbi:MAG: 3-dehydroquinate synthase [Peptococcaceae bacterium]|nr:3-dehydroquinate synthase [Peptococcaceae bacterium]
MSSLSIWKEDTLLAREVTVNLGPRSYPICIGDALLPETGWLVSHVRLTGRVMVVTNPTVGKLYGEVVRGSLEKAGFTVVWAEIPDGEEFKTLDTASLLYDTAFQNNLDRWSAVIALGGGVVGDVAGFVAATYMRGVPFIQVPTTLLAQVDSSVGGKVAVNHPKGKNIIGAFYQPRLVIADTGTLKSLPPRELKAGMAEVIKYGVIKDAAFFSWLEKNLDRVLALDNAALQQVVEVSCRIKAEVVEADETEQGMRQILNFGHTVGHALESLTNYEVYRHGEAVAIGMVAAARIAVAMGLLPAEEFERLRNLVVRCGLPEAVPDGIDPKLLWTYLHCDKKARGRKVVFVLPRAIGQVIVCDNVVPEVFKQVVR